MYSALPYGNQSLLATFQVASAPLLTYIFAFLSAPQIKMLGQALGLLVPVSYIHTALPPPAYQPCSLHGSLLAYAMGNLISKGASRLDAFSVYPVRT